MQSVKGLQGAKASVELSLFMYRKESGDSLIYFDPEGRRYERHIPREKMEAALEKLSDGKPKAVARSSGGLIMVQPMQLVMYSPIGDAESQDPELRVRVRFLDFRSKVGDPVANGRVERVNKDVLPNDIRPGFRFHTEETQRFMIDLGYGPIPIHLYGFEQDQDGTQLALFVEWSSIQRIKKGLAHPLSLQRYKVPQAIVRHALDQVINGAVHTDWVKARQNYLQLLKEGKVVIPESMKIGHPVEIQPGVSLEAICRRLDRIPLRGDEGMEQTGTQEEFLSYMAGI